MIAVRPTVRFRRLPHGLGLPLPQYQTKGAAAMDLSSADDYRIEPGQIVVVKSGFAIEIPRGYEGQVRGRSSLGLRGVTIANGVGTIDSDYRGEVLAVLINRGQEPFEIAMADRVAQLVIAPIFQAHTLEVDELSATERGEAGFGSTGRR